MAELKTKEGLIVGLIKRQTASSKSNKTPEQETSKQKSPRRK